MIEMVVEDRLLNRIEILHGGCLSTAIDAALAHEAIDCTVHRTFTLTTTERQCYEQMRV